MTGRPNIVMSVWHRCPQGRISIFFGGGGSDQHELVSPAHFTVLKMTSRNQGSELSNATMIPQWLWQRIWHVVRGLAESETGLSVGDCHTRRPPSVHEAQ